MLSHIVHIKHLVDQHQPTNNIADRCLLRRVHNTCVLNTRSMETKEIIVLSNDYTMLQYGTLHMLFIRSTKHTDLSNSYYLNTTLS